MRILILGGTTEARELATRLHEHGVDVTTSLAGRVAQPRRPPGATRIGGFGGTEGLKRWVSENAIDALVDATHPFATRISRAATQAGVPLLRLERPGWTETPGDDWLWVDDLEQAAAATAGHRVLLTTGQQDLAAFRVHAAWFLIRTISPPDAPLPPHHELLLDRGPFTLSTERGLLERHAIDLVVTKDSGGPAPKLQAARERHVRVVVVRRPVKAAATTVETVAAALRELLS
jgi:precorrin-6A/cobalt-precorrin-6A reductase